jgi:glycosyltransferase involved in cell wall biosynthesis
MFPTKIANIFEPWDLQHRHIPENFSQEEINFRDWLYPRGCYQANLVVTASHWTKQDLIQTYAVPAEKIAVVYRGAPQFSSLQIRGYRKTFVEKTKLGLRTPYLIYPAKTWPHKNHDRLVRAVAILKKRGQEICLVCTGTVLEGNRESLASLIAEAGLESLIHLVDHLPDGEFLPLLARARGLVFPSLFEGLGIPVLEAMALGVPVACSQAACLPEVCGEAALLFDPYDPQSMADAMAQLWNDSRLRQKLRARGRVQAAQFSWREAAEKFRLLYRFLAKKELMPNEIVTLKSLFANG